MHISQKPVVWKVEKGGRFTTMYLYKGHLFYADLRSHGGSVVYRCCKRSEGCAHVLRRTVGQGGNKIIEDGGLHSHGAPELHVHTQKKLGSLVHLLCEQLNHQMVPLGVLTQDEI